MDVEVFSENEQDQNKLDDDVLVDFVHQKGNESAHDWVDGDSLNAVVEDFLHLYFLFQRLLDWVFDLLFEFEGEGGEYFL